MTDNLQMGVVGSRDPFLNFGFPSCLWNGWS